MLSKAIVPEGKKGDWAIDKFTITKEQAEFANLRALINRRPQTMVDPGEYTRLTHQGGIVMTDTPMEMRMHQHFYHKAEGRVFISGLGLGVIASAVASKDEVEYVLVIEIQPEVIDLVMPHLTHLNKLHVICHDAYTFKPTLSDGRKFDWGWHDIWNEICGDNLDDMKRLHRHYARYITNQRSWSRDDLERMK